MKVVLDRIYESKQGSKQYVKTCLRYREMFKGEPLENTSPIYQIIAHRVVKDTRDGIWYFVEDLDYFCMMEDTFIEEYKEIGEVR